MFFNAITDIEECFSSGVTCPPLEISSSHKLQIKEIIVNLEKIEDRDSRENALKSTLRTLNRIGKPAFLQVYKELIITNELTYNPQIEEMLIKKIQKSGSGIVSVTVVTSPGDFSCPQNCHYCPNEPGIPRSYVSKAPSIIRASAFNFDVVRQFRERLFQLKRMGHPDTKIEVIVLGGTWSYHTKEYQEQFITGIYYAANTMNLTSENYREISTLENEIKLNETAESRIIGLTIETRPDQITEDEIRLLRKYNVTRVQLGIQHIEDRILKHLNRKCTTMQAIQAIDLLKRNGFKVDGHFMLDLPGSSKELDLEMFEYLFSDENIGIQVDQMKLYPTMTTEFTKILEWYKDGLYIPYSDDPNVLFDVIVNIFTKIPRWIRVNRIVRDIPGSFIASNFKELNLYQRLLKYLNDNNLKSQDIRYREIKFQEYSNEPVLKVTKYDSGSGIEYFIEYVTNDDLIIGFLRLRINDIKNDSIFDEIKNTGIIRELHVYGKLVSQEKAGILTGCQQHKGLGKRLIEKAESICLEHSLNKISVISGVGVRGYYEKRGFELANSYMVKTII